jgi:hypothetical protein
MNQVIKQAIASKKLVEFMYSSHIRVVEPHVLVQNQATFSAMVRCDS